MFPGQTRLKFIKKVPKISAEFFGLSDLGLGDFRYRIWVIGQTIFEILGLGKFTDNVSVLSDLRLSEDAKFWACPTLVLRLLLAGWAHLRNTISVAHSLYK